MSTVSIIAAIIVGALIVSWIFGLFKKKDEDISVRPTDSLVGDEDTYISINTRGKRYKMVKRDNSYSGRHKSHWAYFDEDGIEILDMLIWDFLYEIAEDGAFDDELTSDWIEDDMVVESENSPEFDQSAHLDSTMQEEATAHYTPDPSPVYEDTPPVYVAPDPTPVYESPVDTSDSYSRSSSSSYESSDSSSSYDSGSSDSGGGSDD
jgi:hypothetical protein